VDIVKPLNAHFGWLNPLHEFLVINIYLHPFHLSIPNSIK
jgi:hypothetical protein